ncbi:MAG: carboxypeptidase regulatory-like domain-containing protein [Planctomycetaceae bacterium]|nr:carboxypeptidase regulatory-like domain-containing protein [Planctomycetaceae bacterium]MBN8601071.1 carboxypeptidase regulatory-like domain-containing protein [Planctomycetota bacterium]
MQNFGFVHRYWSYRVGLLSLSLFIAAIMGCGPSHPPTYPVVGKVVFENGEACQLGTIEFRSLDHLVSARGKIEKDGSFKLSTWEPDDGAVAGKHQVIIQQMIITEDLSFAAHGHGPRVNPRYGDYATSGIEISVEPVGKNEVTVTLKLVKGK